MSMNTDHLEGILLGLAKQMKDIARRLELVENIIHTRIVISCPAEGCSATFTSNGHRNRHVKDWVQKKDEHEPLWREHKRVVENPRLRDDQGSDSDDPQGDRLPVLRSASTTPPSKDVASRDLGHTHDDILPQFHYPAKGDFEFAARLSNLPLPDLQSPPSSMSVSNCMDLDLPTTSATSTGTGLNHEEGSGRSPQDQPIPFGWDELWSVIVAHWPQPVQDQTGQLQTGFE
ncbi:hypothetical protein F4810DRAFT_721155 [Camillea tinctor]|nr:hypothetical protein F4810DRAFT_721155 [Camillea tinctor]